MTPTRSRIAAALLMLAFTAAIVAALSVHPRTTTVDAATEAPVTQAIRSDDVSSSASTVAPSTTSTYAAKAAAYPSVPRTAPPATPPYWTPPTTTSATSATTSTTTPRAASPVTTNAPIPYIPPPPPPTTSPGGGSNSDIAFLACVKQRESGGNYGAVNPGGYYGAYQFSISTWNTTAQHAGRGDLVGVRPDHASPADQDAMAMALLHWQGRAPWGGYCG